MKMKIPRKKKKVLKRNCVIDTFMVMKFNWHFNKRMVIVNNYINAGIAINLTNEDKNYIKNGLLNNPRFNNYFI